MLMKSKPHLWVMLDTWMCRLRSTSFLNKDNIHPRLSSMRSVFSRLLTRLSQLAASIHKFDHEGFSAYFPSAICFVSRRDRFSPALLLWVCQAILPCARVLNLYHPFLNQEANTTGAFLSIDSPVEYTHYNRILKLSDKMD